MKKVLSVILAVIMCFSMVSVAASAQTADFALKLQAPETANSGDVITVTVSIDQNVGYAGLHYALVYDNVQLQLQEATVGADFAGDGANGMLAMFSDDLTKFINMPIPADTESSGVCTKTGTLVTYKFKVLANGVSADEDTVVNIGLKVELVFNQNLEDLTMDEVPIEANVNVKYTDKLPMVADLTDDGKVDAEDVKYLLNHTLFGDLVPLPVQPEQVDYTHDGKVDTEDVKYLLNHTLFGDLVPIV